MSIPGFEVAIIRFRYYGASSVCIFRFLVSPSDPAWKFSLFINLFNFFAFIFVLCTYVAIIWKVIGKKSTEDVRKPSGRELKELKSKFYFLHFYAWSK